jgi:hypothetical protein
MQTHAKHQVLNVVNQPRSQPAPLGAAAGHSGLARRAGFLAAALLALVVAGCGGNGGGSGGNGATGGGGSAGQGGTGGVGGTDTGGTGGTNTGGTDTDGTGGTNTGGSGGTGGAGGGALCGGIAGVACADSAYCDFPDAAMCGAGDQGGTCQPRPDTCTKDCPGVCGCDGQFYCNACIAAQQGMDVSPDASCTPPQPASCGGFTGAICDDNQYCDYPDEAMCGAGDQTGACQPKPEVCADDCPGVCGCDGQTYCNACKAAQAGSDVNAGIVCAP